MTTSRYSSFLVRFFPGQENVPPEELRGQVQHVQTGAIHTFVGLEAMEARIRQHFETSVEGAVDHASRGRGPGD